MIDLDKLSKSQRALVNALVIAGITFFSTLVAEPGLPTIEHLYSALIAAALVCLIRVKDIIDTEPPKNGKNGLSAEEKKPEPFKIGMVV